MYYIENIDRFLSVFDIEYQKGFQGDLIKMMSPKAKKTISAVIVIALILAMVLTMVLPYIV